MAVATVVREAIDRGVTGPSARRLATGAVVIGLTAMKWTRRPELATPQAPMDADLAERLDDELRNLD